MEGEADAIVLGGGIVIGVAWFGGDIVIGVASFGGASSPDAGALGWTEGCVKGAVEGTWLVVIGGISDVSVSFDEPGCAKLDGGSPLSGIGTSPEAPFEANVMFEVSIGGAGCESGVIV